MCDHKVCVTTSIIFSSRKTLNILDESPPRKIGEPFALCDYIEFALSVKRRWSLGLINKPRKWVLLRVYPWI